MASTGLTDESACHRLVPSLGAVCPMPYALAPLASLLRRFGHRLEVQVLESFQASDDLSVFLSPLLRGFGEPPVELFGCFSPLLRRFGQSPLYGWYSNPFLRIAQVSSLLGSAAGFTCGGFSPSSSVVQRSPVLASDLVRSWRVVS